MINDIDLIDDTDDNVRNKDEIDEEALYPNEKTEPQELNLSEDDDDFIIHTFIHTLLQIKPR